MCYGVTAKATAKALRRSLFRDHKKPPLSCFQRAQLPGPTVASAADDMRAGIVLHVAGVCVVGMDRLRSRDRLSGSPYAVAGAAPACRHTILGRVGNNGGFKHALDWLAAAWGDCVGGLVARRVAWRQRMVDSNQWIAVSSPASVLSRNIGYHAHNVGRVPSPVQHQLSGCHRWPLVGRLGVRGCASVAGMGRSLGLRALVPMGTGRVCSAGCLDTKANRHILRQAPPL